MHFDRQEAEMFMRITSYKIDPDKAQEVDAKLDHISAILGGIAGLKHSSVGRDDGGNGAVIGIYESEAAAKAGEETVAKAWASLSGLMTSQPQRQEFSTYNHLAGTA